MLFDIHGRFDYHNGDLKIFDLYGFTDISKILTALEINEVKASEVKVVRHNENARLSGTGMIRLCKSDGSNKTLNVDTKNGTDPISIIFKEI